MNRDTRRPLAHRQPPPDGLPGFTPRLPDPREVQVLVEQEILGRQQMAERLY
ncbi:MAG: hypothetical protein OEY14_18830 [Myxococcales bacterium]|nr:hypothetical protein [Myxococcales bacterium]